MNPERFALVLGAEEQPLETAPCPLLSHGFTSKLRFVDAREELAQDQTAIQNRARDPATSLELGVEPAARIASHSSPGP